MSKRKASKGDKAASKDSAETGISVAGHPRSASAVRRAKGLGGLLGAVLATTLGMKAGLPPLDAMVRGLAGGIFAYVAMWAVAVTVARQLVIAEVRARYEEIMRARALAADTEGA